VPVGKGFIRKPPKRVDYLLRYTRDFNLAVVEAKASYKIAADAVQQARAYAEMLQLKFAYATNGEDIIEIDYFTGKETRVTGYPTPAELWSRYQQGSGVHSDKAAEQLLTPFNRAEGKGERYYQQIAINRTVEAIIKGDNRLLITMATGTGKTFVAFQICCSCGRRAGIVLPSTAVPAFSTLQTVTSSLTSRRTGCSPHECAPKSAATIEASGFPKE
jgi:type I restriction enzyme R subunit